MTNKKFTRQKQKKDDEFFTMLSDIEAELPHYHAQLKNKTIYMNCDDWEVSNF